MPVTRTTERPNILFIITDQQRADWLGCTGHPVLRTPNIDRIAAGGTVFDRAYVGNPVCMPNRASLMTGRLSSVTGVRQNGNPLPPFMTTFTEVLSAGGYDTALIGKAHFQTFTEIPAPIGSNPAGAGRLANAVDIGPDTGFVSESIAGWRARGPDVVRLPYYGFDHADLVTFHGDMTGGAHEHWLRQQVPDLDALRGPHNGLPHDYTCPQALRTALPEALYSTSYVKMRALEYLNDAARRERPFFAFVSFPDPHHPFTPPGRYWDMYRPEDMVLPDNLGGHVRAPRSLDWIFAQEVVDGPDSLMPQTFVTGAMRLNERQLREAMALTCGMTAMIDDAVGEILDALERNGQDRDTIIVFTSDHGDYMGDHGLILKGGPHFQSLIRVPLLIKDPRRVAQCARTQALASTLDMAPTILAMAGLTPFADIQGIDLGPVLDGATPSRDALLIEEDSYDVDLFGLNGQYRARTLQTGRYRLTTYLGERWGELYDLQEDPLERVNLWDEPGARELHHALIWQLMQAMMDGCSRSPWPTWEA
ncbi:MAG: sulfatase-like hydrolase/transferase [Burkholderiaceae bacterium]